LHGSGTVGEVAEKYRSGYKVKYETESTGDAGALLTNMHRPRLDWHESPGHTLELFADRRQSPAPGASPGGAGPAWW
jgi:hypothetical protein